VRLLRPLAAKSVLGGVEALDNLGNALRGVEALLAE
jgi:hypothetical protein